MHLNFTWLCQGSASQFNEQWTSSTKNMGFCGFSQPSTSSAAPETWKLPDEVVAGCYDSAHPDTSIVDWYDQVFLTANFGTPASKADLWFKISSFPVFVTEITTFSTFFVFFGYVFWTSPRSPRTRWSHSHFRVWTPAGPIYMCACININIYV